MPELLAMYWPYLLIAFVIGLAVAWFAFAANRKTAIKRDPNAPKDVLDEGAARAARNEALINSAPAAGELSSAANSQKVAHVSAQTDAEAGPAIAPSTPTPTSQAAAAASVREGDELTRIKGLGPKIAAMLNEQGITRYAQIASWSDSDIDRIDAGLGRFEGRIRRDSWVEQAKLLASGDESAFSERFGNT
ncbi:hypothetical protein [Altererythrobacter sp. GH1-8]|uniref:hypothetical protein n=1 Tax=Altererythrobacter sp. GH1-8 TaxID=3349333 RepID=UPI00374CFD62